MSRVYVLKTCDNFLTLTNKTLDIIGCFSKIFVDDVRVIGIVIYDAAVFSGV